VSLSAEPAYSELKNHFVCGYRNIMGERYAGNSGSHGMNGNAVDTTNGAGPHNIQMFVIDPDGTVIHCLPGYWNSVDLAYELEFARKLDNVHNDHALSDANKNVQFTALQLNHSREHSPDMVARSRLQDFDAKFESTRKQSDFVKDPQLLQNTAWGPASLAAFRTTDQVFHQRMATMPFVPYSSFQTAKFCDYGQHTYDKHEDALDEDGRLVGDHEVKWIKNAASGKQSKQPPTHSSSVNSYIKTYGKLRSQPAEQN
jgi:hypothetical protein